MQNVSIMAHLDANEKFRIQRLETSSKTPALWIGEIAFFFKSTAQVEQLRDTLTAFLQSEYSSVLLCDGVEVKELRDVGDAEPIKSNGGRIVGSDATDSMAEEFGI